ncbi:MAG: 50S ribosomal protein L11 methyltransferase [Patescibacteria group bacterium]|nr:MAG: 50S ribosomal protein L11 methyltransferase [Patescibacteria group bacterium]
MELFLLGVIIILLLFLLSMIWPPDSPWSPWWRTNKVTAKKICKLAKVSSNDMIYDLGCGDGTALITAAKISNACGIGIEIDPLRVLIAKIRTFIHGVSHKITVERGDFFKVDISQATVVFVYLIPKTLKRLEKKFLAELKPGTKIVSYVYPIDYLPLLTYDVEHQIYVYEIPHQSINSGKG